jgi:hypothetical protein
MINNKEVVTKSRNQSVSQGGNAVYGLGLIGAIVYYFQHAHTFWFFLLGFLKAIVWPAFLIHALLGFLHM